MVIFRLIRDDRKRHRTTPPSEGLWITLIGYWQSGFYENKSAKSVRSNKNKKQFLIIIITQILQVRLTRDDQHFLECVFFIR